MLIILGAGSSVALGLPSVRELDALVRGWAKDWSDHRRWPNYYGQIEAAARTFPGRDHAPETPSFESLLGVMAGLAHWVMPPPSPSHLRQALGSPSLPPDFRFPFPEGYGPTQVIQDQLEHLLKALAAHLRQLSRQIDASSPPAVAYKRLLDALHPAFDIGIYNLNYDASARIAWPQAFTGFRDRAFSAAEVHERQSWGFAYHLHGSVHHSLADAHSDRIEWRDDLSGDFDDGHQPSLGDERSDGRAFPKTTLIAGGFKLDQLLAEPFHSFHAALVRHAYQADAILIGGYGFADAHVNRALRNRLEAAPADRRPPIAVLDWAARGSTAMTSRTDTWSLGLARNLLAPTHFFREPGHDEWPIPADLVQRGAFEVSALHRVAIWHGGFERAADRANDIATWLSTADLDALRAPTPGLR